MRFTESEFEAQLPLRKSNDEPLWYGPLINGGELCYKIDMGDPNVMIWVRSTLDPASGRPSPSKEKIICYLVDVDDNPVSDTMVYTNRDGAWSDGLWSCLSELRQRRMENESR